MNNGDDASHSVSHILIVIDFQSAFSKEHIKISFGEWLVADLGQEFFVFAICFFRLT